MPQQVKEQENVLYIHNKILFSPKGKSNYDIYREMGRTEVWSEVPLT